MNFASTKSGCFRKILITKTVQTAVKLASRFNFFNFQLRYNLIARSFTPVGGGAYFTVNRNAAAPPPNDYDKPTNTATATPVSVVFGRGLACMCKGRRYFAMEDYLPPSLRRFYTDEPTSGSLGNVKKNRALFLNKTLDEKAEDARWYRQDVAELGEVLTWPEYAEDMGLDSPTAKKPTTLSNPRLNSKVSLWQGDITKLDVDVIVNAANRSLLGGGGVDGAIHRAAGSHLLQECRTLAGCETGDAKLTAGYLLPARYVLHTVGPIVNGPTATANHREDLSGCYAACLQRILDHNKRNRSKLEAKRKKNREGAKEVVGPADRGDNGNRGGDSKDGSSEVAANGKQSTEDDCGSDILKGLRHDLEIAEPLIRSVAFPCISTGVYGYPQEDACRVALGLIKDWLEENPEELERVVFCVFLESDLKIYERLLPSFFPLESVSLTSRNEEEDET